jgi:hypothetical protein
VEPGKKARSILHELDGLLLHKDKEHLIESRASNVISGAINLINYIKESYDPCVADELERRLLNSIKSQNPEKFIRGIRRIKNEIK